MGNAQTTIQTDLTHIIDILPVIFSAVDKNLRIVLWSKGAEQVTGWSKKDILDDPSSRQLLYPNKKIRNKLINQLEHGAKLRGYELPVHCKNGRIKTVAWYKLDTPPDKVHAAWYIGIDITAQKEAEAAVEASELRIRALTNSISRPILTADQHGKIVQVNPEAERTFGWRERDLIGKPLTIIFPSKYHSRRVFNWEDIEKGSISQTIGRGTIEIEGQNSRGQIFPIDLVLSSWMSDGSRYFTAVIRDITERKNTERELEESRQQLQEYIDTMFTLNAKLDLKGNFLLINRIAEVAVGLPHDEIMKTNFLEGRWWTFDHAVQKRVKAAFSRAVKGEIVVYDEQMFIMEQVLTINFSLSPVKKNGKVHYIVAEGRDISRQKQFEAVLHEQTRELEALNRFMIGREVKMAELKEKLAALKEGATNVD